MNQDDYTIQTISFYDQNSKEYADIEENLLNIEEINKFIKHLPPNNKKILDVGCGAGRDARILKEKGYQVWGIDLSKGLLKEARKRSSDIQYELMDMRKIRYEDNNFDGIFAAASLLHLPTKKDVEITIKELSRILKKEGLIHIRVREKKDIESEFKQARITSGKPRFFRYFSKKYLEELLKKHKFEILESYIFNSKDRGISKNGSDWICIFAKKLT